MICLKIEIWFITLFQAYGVGDDTQGLIGSK